MTERKGEHREEVVFDKFYTEVSSIEALVVFRFVVPCLELQVFGGNWALNLEFSFKSFLILSCIIIDVLCYSCALRLSGPNIRV